MDNGPKARDGASAMEAGDPGGDYDAFCGLDEPKGVRRGSRDDPDGDDDVRGDDDAE